MADIATWLASSPRSGPDETLCAVSMWQHILDKPSSIVVRRGATLLSDQTVRIEQAPAGEMASEANIMARRGVTVFGVRNHPTETAVDLQRGDHFVYGDIEYRILDVVVYAGHVQAIAEAVL